VLFQRDDIDPETGVTLPFNIFRDGENVWGQDEICNKFKSNNYDTYTCIILSNTSFY
jgi:hypothetical protein